MVMGVAMGGDRVDGKIDNIRKLHSYAHGYVIK